MKKIIIEFEAEVPDKVAKHMKEKGICVNGVDEMIFILRPSISKKNGLTFKKQYTFKCRGARIVYE